MFSTGYIYITFLLFLMQNPTTTVFDFTKTSEIQNWYVMNDGVMGGLSKGNFSLHSDGYGVFKGFVSLENNGGFSSVRYRFSETSVNKHSKIILKIKGDGKRYQFRVKDKVNNQHSYITYFETTGDWQIIIIPMQSMYPTFRGRKLYMPNYSGQIMEEVAFLIANKKAEDFELQIQSITLE